MGSHITYKLLYNDAVAMTGGQHPESGFSVAQITRQLAAEGVAKTVVVADEPERYASVTDLAPGVEVKPRAELMAVQRDAARRRPASRVLIYDQVCATEKRRRRKRGTMAAGAAAGVHQPAGLRGLRRLLASLQLRLDRAAGHRVRPQAQDRPVDLQPGLFLPRRLLPLVRHAGRRRERPRASTCRR